MSDPAHSRPHSLITALLPLLVLVGGLAWNVHVFGDEAIGGPNQLVLLLAAAVAIGIGVAGGMRFPLLLERISASIATAIPAILILLLIGALAGTWLIAGIVPQMIDHGLVLLSPKAFLVAACISCAFISLATGSSWTTAATVGIALMGIGRALGVHEGLVAGAVISGAYFGDKLSPLSDTTNLAPAVAGAELFAHIRYMLHTTVPSITITLLLFAGIGLWGGGQGALADAADLRVAIADRFTLGPWLYIPPLAVIGMIWKRVPALPALFVGALLGAVFAVLFQPALIQAMASEPQAAYGTQAYDVVMRAMGGEMRIVTGNPVADELLKGKGMAGMLSTIWLILAAMVFGGAMEGTGLLQRITAAVMALVRGDGSLIATTAGSCVFVNVTASDQYLSIVVPGRMYAPVFRTRGLHPKVLSRTLEDAGTVTSPLVPWNTCGAYQSGVLGVAVGTYLPFCFFNLISPLMTVVQGAIGWRIARSAPSSVDVPLMAAATAQGDRA